MSTGSLPTTISDGGIDPTFSPPLLRNSDPESALSLLPESTGSGRAVSLGADLRQALLAEHVRRH